MCLQRIVLAGGAKSYGFRVGAFNAPAKETEPRLIAPIHYHQQEDIVAEWAGKNGASWTVLRPHLVMGPSLNSPMNPVTSLATYAAMTRELGLPLRFPGTKEGWNTLQETTDAELFGRATLWVLGEDKARNQIFNVSNGDVYRWRQLWNELPAFYDLPIAEPLAMSTVSEMSEKAPLWDSMVIRYGLHATHSPDYAICASSPDGPACLDAPDCSQELREAASENCRCGDLVMNRTASKKRELSKRSRQPSTYRRIVTGNVSGKSIVQSDEQLQAYQFKSVPDYEHTLVWVNPSTPDLREEQRFDRYPDSVVPGPGGTSLHFVTFPPCSVFADPSFDGEAVRSEALIRIRGLADHFEKEDPAQDEHRRLRRCL
jgi:hypothetical protein